MEPETEIARFDPTTFAVRDLIGASQDLVVRMARAMGMNVTDMTAVHLLGEHGPMGAAELAERLGIRSASATVLVDRLEAAGHVARTPHPTDRRRVTVTATAEAQAYALDVWLPGLRLIDEVCRSLSTDEAAVVRAFLGRLAAAMDGAGREVTPTDAGPASR
ncbi:MarR family winged helix-turn-helix transcriptional regulator [Actinomycetospora soli]|uniref:MarR family winged helix-turn-helix transcriptional regulator n=1 Tax=Actinomycetospora soli TaxID=2893887 RepID=UPI001E42BB8D|nr:MarR family transcriptional regulator [Actinomycetospora soli]MCD2187927.1 MarR family transcriptional regulator [Actinomycetospora soli]